MRLRIAKFMIRSLVVFLIASAVFAAGPPVGEASPDLLGRTLEGKLFRLGSQPHGVKVINFFWIGCVPCRKEMPELAELEKKFPAARFIAVHSQDESPEDIAAFVRALPAVPATVVATSGTVKETFSFTGLPHTVVVDKNNIVKMNLSGYTAENMKKLTALLADIAGN